jgi:hypothetical protein
MPSYGIEYEIPGTRQNAISSMNRGDYEELSKVFDFGEDFDCCEFRSKISNSFKQASNKMEAMLSMTEKYKRHPLFTPRGDLGIHIHIGMQSFDNERRLGRLLMFLNDQKDKERADNFFKLSGRIVYHGYYMNAKPSLFAYKIGNYLVLNGRQYNLHKGSRLSSRERENKYELPDKTPFYKFYTESSVNKKSYWLPNYGRNCILAPNYLGTLELRMFASDPKRLLPALQFAEALREFSYELKHITPTPTYHHWYSFVSSFDKYKDLIKLCEDEEVSPKRSKKHAA